MQVSQSGTERKACIKTIFVLSSSRNFFLCVEDKKLASHRKHEILSFKTWKPVFTNHKVSCLVAKTAKCKRGITFSKADSVRMNLQ